MGWTGSEFELINFIGQLKNVAAVGSYEGLGTNKI